MADISSIQIKGTNGQVETYNIKDEFSRIFSTENVINIANYDVKNDGSISVSSIIQNIINNNPHKTIYFPAGKYLLSDPLKIKMGNEYQVNLLLDENAIITSNVNINALLEIANDTEGSYDKYNEYGKLFVSGGVWDCSNCNYGIYTTSNRKFTTLKNLYLINVKKYGIYLDRGTIGSTSTDAKIFNVSISGEGTDINNEAVGIYIYGTDNELNEIRIQRVKKGIYLYSGGDLISNVHITAGYSKENILASEYNNSIGIECNGGGTYLFSNIYIDTLAQSIVVSSSNVSVFISNFYTIFWKQDEDFTTSIIKFNKFPTKFIINGGNLQPPTKGIIKGVNIDELTSDYWEYFNLYNNIKFLNIQTYNGMFQDIDPLKCLQLQNRESYNVITPAWSVPMEQNKHYQIAVLRKGTYDLDISMANDQLINAIIKVEQNNPLIKIKNLQNNSHTNQYTLELINGAVDEKGKFYCYLAVKSSGTDTSLNPVISKISSRYANQIYITKNNSTPVDNPIILTSESFNP